MGNGGVMGDVIQLPTLCNCVSVPVTDIEADLAFIVIAPEIFARAIASSNGEMAMKVADQLIESSNALGLYAIHKLHS
jgi:hypothetical protein